MAVGELQRTRLARPRSVASSPVLQPPLVPHTAASEVHRRDDSVSFSAKLCVPAARPTANPTIPAASAPALNLRAGEIR
jgi:hypothetical protein